ncbi:MAG: fibronectin type III domain-containing protein [Eubacteriales bacterium]|nr:fibronectin type III domain-containing protein [Eubacteriales bacterium]
MKKIISLIMAAVMAVSYLSFSVCAYADDSSSAVSSVAENAVSLVCDGKWREYNTNGTDPTVTYSITASAAGKLNVKIQAFTALDAVLSSSDFRTEYFNVRLTGSGESASMVRNQMLQPGTYYLTVRSEGKYTINATFGGNSSVNPQILPINTKVSGSNTQDENGWWYKLTVSKDAYYIVDASANSNAYFKLYDEGLTNVIKESVLSGNSKTADSQKTTVYLDKGTYYINVNSDGKYQLSWYKLTQKNCTHSYKSQTVKSTFTAKGYRLHTCTICGYSYKDSYTAKKKLSAPSSVSLKKGSRKLTVKFSRSFYATGYQIQYSTSKKFTSKTTKKITTKDTSKTVKNLKGGKKYYVRVRAYKKVDGKTVFSSWSEVKSITVKR